MTGLDGVPVSVSEIQDVLNVLSSLAVRAGEAGQGTLQMICGLAAESLADNLEMAVSMDADDE